MYVLFKIQIIKINNGLKLTCMGNSNKNYKRADLRIRGSLSPKCESETNLKMGKINKCILMWNSAAC